MFALETASSKETFLLTSQLASTSEYCSESENEGIGSSSESELESVYLNESFQGMKPEPSQYEPLKKNSSSKNYLAEEEKGIKIVAS